MGNELRLKSCPVEVYDFTQVDISQFFKGFEVDEDQYAKDLGRILRRFGKKEEVDVVAEGDMVTVSCSSELARYNKAGMPVQVGKGLLNPTLEAALVGMGIGETKTLSIDGADVTMTVERAVRTVLPELTDEAVAGFGMEGVSTVSDLRKRCIERQVERYILDDENPDMASAFVWQRMAEHCRVQRDPDEVAYQTAKAEKKLEELRTQFVPEPGEEITIDTEMLLNIFLDELDLAAVGQSLMEQKNDLNTEDDYAAWIDKLQEAYPGLPREELERQSSRMEYMISQYADHLAQEIDAFVASVYKAHYTKE